MSEHLGDALIGLAALLAGGLLGGVFFGGLWWTVQRAVLSVAPARWARSLLSGSSPRTAAPRMQGPM